MIKKQATNLAAIRKGDDIIAKVYKGDTLRYNSAHSITYILDGIVTPSQTKVKHNAPLTLSFTTETGKKLLPSTVRVTMGGVDVTSTAYKLATNTVEIPAVTGDVTITAGAASVDSAYKPLLYVATRAAAVGNMITLPYKANSNTKLVMDVDLALRAYTALYNAKRSIAAPTSSNPNYVFFVRVHNTTVWKLVHGTTYQDTTTGTSGRMMMGQRVVFTNDKGIVSYKNQAGNNYTRTYSGGTWSINSDVGIMALNNTDSTANGAYSCDGKLYRVEISEPTEGDGNILLDYIPIMRLSDGKVGIYDLVNGNAVVNNNYIAPYNTLASGLTNCSASLLSGTGTGTTARAVIGSTWSIEIAPSTDATFNHSDASISLFINGVDVTNLTNDDTAHTPYVQYDSAADTYTITIVNVPQEEIALTAVAYAESNGTNSLNFNNGLLGSINGDEPNEIDPIAMEDM